MGWAWGNVWGYGDFPKTTLPSISLTSYLSVIFDYEERMIYKVSAYISSGTFLLTARVPGNSMIETNRYSFE